MSKPLRLLGDLVLMRYYGHINLRVFFYIYLFCCSLCVRVCSFLCSDSFLYTSFFFSLFFMVFIHVIVHALINQCKLYYIERDSIDKPLTFNICLLQLNASTRVNMSM